MKNRNLIKFAHGQKTHLCEPQARITLCGRSFERHPSFEREADGKPTCKTCGKHYAESQSDS